jgi:replication factor C small subunit
MSSVWTKKYRPTTLDGVAGCETLKQAASGWIDNPSSMPPALLFHGPPGTGKTTVAYVLGHGLFGDSMKLNFHEINASDDRGISVVRSSLKEIAKMGGIDAPYRIIFLDEADGLTNDAQEALRRIMEQHTDTCRWILSCNRVNAIVPAIRSRCAGYRFTPLSFNACVHMLHDVMEKELVPDEWFNYTERLVRQTQGDLRQCLLILQTAAKTDDGLTDYLAEEEMKFSEAFTALVSKDITNSDATLTDLYNKGFAVRDIITGLHAHTVESSLGNNHKRQLLKCLGEAHYRDLSMTPKLLLSWLAAVATE